MAVVKVKHEELFHSQSSINHIECMHLNCTSDDVDAIVNKLLTAVSDVPAEPSHKMETELEDTISTTNSTKPLIDNAFTVLKTVATPTKIRISTTFIASSEKLNFVATNQNFNEADLNEYELCGVESVQVKREFGGEVDTPSDEDLHVNSDACALSFVDIKCDASCDVSNELALETVSSANTTHVGASLHLSDGSLGKERNCFERTDQDENEGLNSESCDLPSVDIKSDVSYDVPNELVHAENSLETASSSNTVSNPNTTQVNEALNLPDIRVNHETISFEPTDREENEGLANNAQETSCIEGLLDLSVKKRSHLNMRPNISESESHNPLDLCVHGDADRQIISNRMKISSVLRKRETENFGNGVPLDLTSEELPHTRKHVRDLSQMSNTRTASYSLAPILNNKDTSSFSCANVVTRVTKRSVVNSRAVTKPNSCSLHVYRCQTSLEWPNFSVKNPRNLILQNNFDIFPPIAQNAGVFHRQPFRSKSAENLVTRVNEKVNTQNSSLTSTLISTFNSTNSKKCKCGLNEQDTELRKNKICQTNESALTPEDFSAWNTCLQEKHNRTMHNVSKEISNKHYPSVSRVCTSENVWCKNHNTRVDAETSSEVCSERLSSQHTKNAKKSDQRVREKQSSSMTDVLSAKSNTVLKRTKDMMCNRNKETESSFTSCKAPERMGHRAQHSSFDQKAEVPEQSIQQGTNSSITSNGREQSILGPKNVSKELRKVRKLHFNNSCDKCVRGISCGNSSGIAGSNNCRLSSHECEIVNGVRYSTGNVNKSGSKLPDNVDTVLYNESGRGCDVTSTFRNRNLRVGYEVNSKNRSLSPGPLHEDDGGVHFDISNQENASNSRTQYCTSRGDHSSTSSEQEQAEENDSEQLSCALCGLEVENMECLSDHFLLHLRSPGLSESGIDTKDYKRGEKGCQMNRISGINSKSDKHANIHKSDHASLAKNFDLISINDINCESSVVSVDSLRNEEPTLICKSSFSCNRKKGPKKCKNVYRCDHCSKEFRFYQVYVCHKIIHAGQKPYSCAACGTKFSFKKTLVAHLLSEHLKQKTTHGATS